MLVAFSVAPTSTDETGSLSTAVAQAVKIVRDSGLPYQTTAMFTYIEGEWDEIMDVIKHATEAVVQYSPRTSLVLKADIRPGFNHQMQEKVTRIEDKLRLLE